MTIDDIKTAYADIKVEYDQILPSYREIYKKYYPEEYKKLKTMTETGSLKPLSHMDRYLYHSKDIPANFYDPINLRYNDPTLNDKFNFYEWEDSDGFTYPHFDLSEDDKNLLRKLSSMLDFLRGFELIVDGTQIHDVDRFTDSRTCHFEHEDIVITDPCYIMPSDPSTHSSDWNKCMNGYDMEKLGHFTKDKYATADTIYGDWSCTMYEEETSEEIGDFCADSGLVSVFSLAQIKAYNPDYDPTDKPWCATLIKDFTGDVTLKTRLNKYEIERYVEGKGSVNFFSRQTGS